MPQEQQVEPRPEQVFALIRDKREKLLKAPKDMQSLFLGSVFDQYIRPTLQKGGLNPEQMTQARSKWASQMLGQEAPPLDFKGPDVEKPGFKEGLSALGVGAQAKAEGIVKNLLDWDEKLAKYIGDVEFSPKHPLGVWVPHKESAIEKVRNRLRDQASKDEAELYGLASSVSPRAAKAGAMISEAALTAPLYEAGAGVGGALAKAGNLGKTATRVARGAGGMAGVSPLVTSDPSQVAKNVGIGAVAGPVMDPAIEGLLKTLGRFVGRSAGSAVGKRATTQVEKAVPKATNELDAIAQGKFKKDWTLLTPDEKQVIIKETAEATQKSRTAAKVAKKAPGAASATTPTPDSAASSRWRQDQYRKLGKAGIKPIGVIKDKVQKGMTAEQIINERAGVSAPPSVGDSIATSAVTQAENPQVEKAVKGISNIAKEGKGTSVVHLIDEPPTTNLSERKSFYGSEIERAKGIIRNPVATEEEKKYAAVVLKDSREALADLEKQNTGVKKIPEGVHGAGPLGKRAAHAEAEAAARAKAASAQPSVPSGFSEEGKAVPLASQGLPTVELIDSLKGIKVPGFDVSVLYKVLEQYRKAGKVPEDKLLEGIDKTYRIVGEKLSIENADTMPLEELYMKVTSQR